jgi:branched-chain amino acid transport system substrate-binding protein
MRRGIPGCIVALALCIVAAASAAPGAEPIRIGGLIETSGGLATLGVPMLEGARLAVEEVNAAGGINGRPLELVNLNTESDETKAVINAKKLIEQEKVSVIVGPAATGENLAITPTILAAGVPLVANGAALAIVTPVEQKRWIFKVPLSDVLVQEKLLAHMRARGIERIALINSDVGFGVTGREALEKLAPTMAVRLVIQQTFGVNDQDMTAQVTRVRASDAQATVVWATNPGQAIVVKNYRQLAVAKPLYLSHAANDFRFLQLAGAAANGALLGSSKIYIVDQLPAADPQKPVIDRFVKAYQARYNKPPATFAGNGYDAVMIAAEGLRRGGIDRAKVREAIEHLKGHVGITGIYSFSPTDHAGLQPESVVVLEVRDGKWVLAQ